MSISGAFRTLAFCLSTLVVSLAPPSTASAMENGSIDAMTEQIKAGIEQVVKVVAPRYDASVESYLRTYLERNRARTEMMIGRSSLYFPMFEKELEAAGLPTDLKYLAVVESALAPQAISPVGATGLWQFMKPTARECGLQVTKYIDERCDPLKSTKAAIHYLTFLFKQFDSWELAMAAYNSGPGRVRYAIRRSGSKDYWTLQRYLPRETRAYVPGFIAASYVLNYYADHGLTPALPDADLTETATMMVHKGMSFSEIQSITRVPYEVICLLNPVYIRKYIPQSDAGYPLILPAHAAVTMQSYLSDDAKPVVIEEFEGIETGVEMEYVDRLVDEIYHVRSGDNLYNIARRNDCTVDDLKSWNRLSGSTIHIGQQLRIRKMARVLVKVPVAAPPAPTPRAVVEVAALGAPSALALSATTARLAEKSPAATPVQQVRKGMTKDPLTVRRRLSLREMGKEVPAGGECLTPGSCLH